MVNLIRGTHVAVELALLTHWVLTKERGPRLPPPSAIEMGRPSWFWSLRTLHTRMCWGSHRHGIISSSFASESADPYATPRNRELLLPIQAKLALGQTHMPFRRSQPAA